MSAMTPREIVHELDQHIIGQANAKKAVAIALRNRWRRMQLNDDLRAEVTPKNILMIGPTGVGKTEIARRLAKLANAPFIKVEATKFTEVGYVGKEVETIIRDLVEVSIKMTREQQTKKFKHRAEEAAEDRILDALLPPVKDQYGETQRDENSSTRQTFRKKLREGQLDDKEIEIDLAQVQPNVEIMAPPGMEEMTNQLQGMFQNMGGDKRTKRKLKIKEAFKLLTEEEAGKLVNPEELKEQAIFAVEQNGIVFIDEIDKICKRGDSSGPDVSREGVQRDLLPLIEGSTVNTKHGMVKTDHMLFIASGAFQMAKPSDMIPELQGRLPIRVELEALTANDFKTYYLQSLMHHSQSNSASYLKLSKLMFSTVMTLLSVLQKRHGKLTRKPKILVLVRLHTVMEKLMEEISYDASEQAGSSVVIDAAYVEKHLGALVEDEDLSRFIL